MHIATRLALVGGVMILGCAHAPSAPTATPLATNQPPKPERKLVLPEGWKPMPVTKRFQSPVGPVLMAVAVKPSADAVIFIFLEDADSTPESLAEAELTLAGHDHVSTQRADRPAPDTAVVEYNPEKVRGGYIIYHLVRSDGRVMSVEAEFPPDKAEEIIKDTDFIAASLP